MKYKLVYTLRAIKDIESLDPKIRNKIGKTLIRYREYPFRYARKLIDPKIGSYRFRVGDYRVIFDINNDEIIVLRVGHRKDIYRR